MGKFATVRPASDATTVRRKESASLNSLYEVKELFNVGDVDDTENEDPAIFHTAPMINTASNSSWLALSVNGDVSIFAVSADCGYETNVSVKGDVCGLAWLGESSLLSIFTTERCFTMISMKFGKLLEINMHDQAVTQCGSAKISTTEIGDQCFVCIIDNSGVTNTIVFSDWTNFMNCNETEHSMNGLQKVLNSITYSCSQTKHSMTDMLASKALSAIVALPESGDFFITSSFASTSADNQIDNTFLHGVKLNAPIVRIREVCGGRYLVGVTSSGQMIIHDLWSFCHLTYAKPIDLKIGKNARVVDFLFIDKVKEEFSYKNVVLVVQKDDGLSLEVVSLPGGDASYALDIEQGTTLVYAAAESNQRVMIVVEPLQDGHGVTLKEIAEAEPEQKLTRLIEQNRLDEAEKFALEYGLDCQRVHVSRMDILYDETTTNDSPEVFKKFMASMDKVKDDNRVAETCFSGATTLQSFSRIQALLQYVEKRNVTDKYCAEKLASVAYTFGTYRMVTKPEDASFDHWPSFVEGIDGPGEWMGIFDSFLQGGFIADARVIFNRHTMYVIEGISLDISVSSNEAGCAFVESLKNTLMNNIALWPDLISFIEYDVVPRIIQSSDIEVKMYIFMVDFLLFLAKRLEKFDPSNFPENAYHVTTTMERIFRTLSARSITPTKQALLGIIGRKYFSPQSRSHELIVYSENLAAIQRLKEVYHCALSYDNYITLDAERICYHILQSAVENPNMVAARVEKYARPYMDEHRLDPDRTIFRYIEDVSKNALFALSGANPWHEQCLLISETIKNFSLRCQAILIIAKSMQPPWPKRLSDAVQSILGSNLIDGELTKQLQMVCHRAELGKILQSHNVSFSLLDTILSNERQFSRFLRYLVQQEENADELVKSALKAVELYKKLNIETTYQVDDNLVYSSIAMQLLNGRGVKEMIKYLDGLESVDESIQSEVVDTLIDKLLHQINSSVEFKDEIVVNERLNTLYAVESIIQHFRNDDPEQQITYNDVVSIRKLQERYDRWITLIQLHDSEWKEEEFTKYLIDGQHDLPELYAFANAIGLRPDDARIVTIECVIKAGMLQIVASVLKESVSTITKPSAKLVAMYMSGCDFIFNNVHTVYCSDQDNSDALLEEAMDVMWMMQPILSGLTKAATDFEQFLEKSLRMEHFLRLFLMTFDQFAMVDTPSSTDDSQEKFSNSSNICGMSRRVGVYQVQNDGAIMSKKETLAAMLAVAPSVVHGYENSGQNIEQMNEMHNKWDDLCNILTHERQDVLVYAYRVFSAYLPYFYETENIIHNNLLHVANNLCEKTIQMHPCDLWSASAIMLSLVPEETEKLVVKLRSWLNKRKSPQTMINYLRIVQFIVINLGDKNKYGPSLVNAFVIQLWCKRLAKLGSSVKSSKDLTSALEDFSKRKIDPAMVSEYFVQFFPEQADDQMLNYAMMLISKASAATTEADIDALLQTASSAMKLCNSTRNHIYWRCRRALYTLCPYNYEPILFLIRLMSFCVVSRDVESYNDMDSNEPAAFVDGCQNLMELLIHTTRSGGITKAEINWYMQYLKVYQLDKKENGDKVTNRKNPDCFGTRLMAWFEQGSEMNMTLERNDNDLKYERADLLASTLPSRAHNVVPVHIFLVRLQSDVRQWLEPVIQAEVNLYTVKIWKTLRKVVSWLEILPRDMFLLQAVMKKVNECILKGLELQPMDRSMILELFTARNSSVDDVASCIAYSAKNLTLSIPKVQLITLGVEVANGWLESMNLDETTKGSVMDAKLRYEQLVENYKTELLLKKEGLYDSKTSDLVEHPEDLICHIYSENIEWSSRVDIKRKSDLIDQLAAINNVKLSEIRNDLVFRWLAEGESTDALAVNLDDTMGSISLPTMVDTKDDDNDIIPLPLFDASITKIVHLLKQQDYHELFNKIYTKYIRDYTSTSGGYKTAIRAICVLLRTMTDEDFTKYNISDNRLCGSIETILLTRLFEVARVEQPYSCYASQEKLTIARSLMAPTKRHTPELCSVAAAVVIDNDLQDTNLVETLLTKLSQARRKDIYIELLKHCKEVPALANVKNLGSFWHRLIDSSSIHEGSRDEVLYWIYFLLSCPVELRGFDPIRTMSQKLPVAATVLSIASNFTKTVAKIGSYDQAVSEAKDPHFRWSIQQSSSPATSSDDTLEF